MRIYYYAGFALFGLSLLGVLWLVVSRPEIWPLALGITVGLVGWFCLWFALHAEESQDDELASVMAFIINVLMWCNEFYWYQSVEITNWHWVKQLFLALAFSVVSPIVAVLLFAIWWKYAGSRV
jgi:hypothetical protein